MVAVATLVLVLAGVAVLAIDRVRAVGSFGYDGDGAPPFRLAYPGGMERTSPRGMELIRLQQGAGPTLRRQVTATPLRIEQGAGAGVAQLGLDAVAYRERAARAFPDYRQAVEGRVKLGGKGEVGGYQIVFTARYPAGEGSGRGWMRGRILLVPEQVERPHRGVAIELIETGSSREDLVAPAGSGGPLKSLVDGLDVD